MNKNQIFIIVYTSSLPDNESSGKELNISKLTGKMGLLIETTYFIVNRVEMIIFPLKKEKNSKIRTTFCHILIQFKSLNILLTRWAAIEILFFFFNVDSTIAERSYMVRRMHCTIFIRSISTLILHKSFLCAMEWWKFFI